MVSAGANRVMAYRVVLAGLGRIGYVGWADKPEIETHFSVLRDHPRLKLVGCVDVDAEKRQQVQAETGVLVFDNAVNAVRENQPDIVVVATPPDTHAEIVCAVATRVSAVLCEKPMAMSVADCQLMIGAMNGKP